MSAIQPLLLALGALLSIAGSTAAEMGGLDPARLREMLFDRQHPRSQSQAALLLVQGRSADAEEIVRQGLCQTESPEVFLALVEAVQLCRDRRFTDELFNVLTSGRSAAGLRQPALEALAELATDALVTRLNTLAEDTREELAVRQSALWILGRCGRKAAVVALLDHLSGKNEVLRQTAADALTDMTGLHYKLDVARWRNWWAAQRDLSNEGWLEERLAYQASRARRLEGDLERTKSQVVRLHQQLYSRLPAADRLSYVQTLVDHEDPAVRILAVGWSVELLPPADTVGQRVLADVLLRLSRDGSLEVQRPAVLALGRVNDSRAFDSLRTLLRRGQPTVRAAAAHALTQQALGNSTQVIARQRQVVPILQKALEDPALEVVVAAAENLGTLGIPEAGPVLAALLSHPSEPVRQTAAQALERVAEPKILEPLMATLDDASVPVRFSLVGALGHVAGDGQNLTDAQRVRLLARLEEVLLRDADPGVRSRAATVIGQCGPADQLSFLWRRVLSREESRVQEKAFAAMIDILTRLANLELLREWDRTLSEAKQGARRLEMVSEVYNRWKKGDSTRTLAEGAIEVLVQAQLDQGKWAAAFPLVRGLLARTASDTEMEYRLRWLLNVGELALQENNRPEALRTVSDAQPYLARKPELAVEFEKLEKQAKQ